jgi:Homeodomain
MINFNMIGKNSMPLSPMSPMGPNDNNRFSNHMDNAPMINSINMDNLTDLYPSTNPTFGGHDFKPTFYDPFEVKHRRRTTRAQFKVLEKTFQENPKPSATIRRMLAQRLNMTPRGVQVWFQNRRAKAKLQSQQDKQRGVETNAGCNMWASHGTDTWNSPEDTNAQGDNETYTLYNSNTNSNHPNVEQHPCYQGDISSQMKSYYSSQGSLASQKKFDQIQFMNNEPFQGFQFDDQPMRPSIGFSHLHDDESPNVALLRRNSCPANIISNMLPMHVLQQCPLPKFPANNYLASPDMTPKMRRWSAVNSSIIANQEQMLFVQNMPATSESYAASCPGFQPWEVDSASSGSSSPSGLQISMRTPGSSSPSTESIDTTSLPLTFQSSIHANEQVNLQVSQLQCAINSFSVE